MPESALPGVTEIQARISDWTSFCQLIQQLAAGSVRRNTFTQWEMELLLDLQMAPIRKSSRPEILRKYLKTIQRQIASGERVPVRFSVFCEAEMQARRSGEASEPLTLLRAS